MSAVITQMVARKRQIAALDADLKRRADEIVAEAKGDKGDTGPMPDHEWKGTKLRFQKPDGTWGERVDLKGKVGEDGKRIMVMGGTGGSASFNPAVLDTLQTAALLTDFLVLERDGVAYRVSLSALQGMGGGVEDDVIEYSKRVDSVGDSVIYRGEAPPGSDESLPVWRIRRIEFPASGDVVEKWANGNSNFTNAWSDHETLNYA